jgi:hypothetical protein
MNGAGPASAGGAVANDRPRLNISSKPRALRKFFFMMGFSSTNSRSE